MRTTLKTESGFYAAETTDCDQSVPANTMRVYCARIEVYDCPLSDRVEDDISFEYLFSMGEDDPQIAKALLTLGRFIAFNKEVLERTVEAQP